MEEYCGKYCLTMGTDAEGPFVNLGLLMLALNCTGVIVYLDPRDDVEVSCIASESTGNEIACVHVLLRPGHYDLLYPLTVKPPLSSTTPPSTSGTGTSIHAQSSSPTASNPPPEKQSPGVKQLMRSSSRGPVASSSSTNTGSRSTPQSVDKHPTGRHVSSNGSRHTDTSGSGKHIKTTSDSHISDHKKSISDSHISGSKGANDSWGEKITPASPVRPKSTVPSRTRTGSSRSLAPAQQAIYDMLITCKVDLSESDLMILSTQSTTADEALQCYYTGGFGKSKPRDMPSVNSDVHLTPRADAEGKENSNDGCEESGGSGSNNGSRNGSADITNAADVDTNPLVKHNKPLRRHSINAMPVTPPEKTIHSDVDVAKLQRKSSLQTNSLGEVIRESVISSDSDSGDDFNESVVWQDSGGDGDAGGDESNILDARKSAVDAKKSKKPLFKKLLFFL